jgi:tetratricopeptide (TPR) repeat protein
MNFATVLALPLLAGAAPLQEDPVKDAQADLEKFLKKAAPLTLGGLSESLQQTQEAANRQTAGKHVKEAAAICAAAFERLGKAIQELESRPPELRKALLQMEKARKRAADLAAEDKKLVAFRYAMERISLLHRDEANAAMGLVNLGISHTAEANYAEAEDALAEAEARLAALRGTSVETTPEAPRLAPIFLARARMLQGRYKEAAADLRRGLTLSPDWGDREYVFAKDFHKEGDYPKLLKKLEEYCDVNPDDRDAWLLLAHERYFSEKRDAAKKALEKVLKLDPRDAGAAYFLERLKDE